MFCGSLGTTPLLGPLKTRCSMERIPLTPPCRVLTVDVGRRPGRARRIEVFSLPFALLTVTHLLGTREAGEKREPTAQALSTCMSPLPAVTSSSPTGPGPSLPGPCFWNASLMHKPPAECQTQTAHFHSTCAFPLSSTFLQLGLLSYLFHDLVF